MLLLETQKRTTVYEIVNENVYYSTFDCNSIENTFKLPKTIHKVRNVKTYKQIFGLAKKISPYIIGIKGAGESVLDIWNPYWNWLLGNDVPKDLTLIVHTPNEPISTENEIYKCISEYVKENIRIKVKETNITLANSKIHLIDQELTVEKDFSEAEQMVTLIPVEAAFCNGYLYPVFSSVIFKTNRSRAFVLSIVSHANVKASNGEICYGEWEYTYPYMLRLVNHNSAYDIYTQEYLDVESIDQIYYTQTQIVYDLITKENLRFGQLLQNRG